MSNDRIARALTLLTPHLVTIQEPMYFRSLLEDLYDSAQDALLADLISAEQAAVVWGVVPRRARAHISRLHEKYGYGRQLGGMWIIRRAHVEKNPPQEKYRRKV